MKKMLILLMTLAIVSIPMPLWAETASAVLQGTAEDSQLVGMVRFEDSEEGLRIDVQIFGAPSGLHGIHIHENGSCEDKGNAAGGHFNPMKAQHGFLPTDGLEGAHAGDFGNMEINQSGEGSLFLVIPDLTVTGGEHNVEGRSVILHEKQDDFSQPTGNAGGRIGCGIIKLNEEKPEEKTEEKVEESEDVAAPQGQ